MISPHTLAPCNHNLHPASQHNLKVVSKRTEFIPSPHAIRQRSLAVAQHRHHRRAIIACKRASPHRCPKDKIKRCITRMPSRAKTRAAQTHLPYCHKRRFAASSSADTRRTCPSSAATAQPLASPQLLQQGAQTRQVPPPCSRGCAR